MSGPTIEEFARENDPTLRALIGSIRRMAIKVTSKVLWQLVGHKIGDKPETLQAEPFTGIGFYSRPPANGKPEAIAVFAGGAKSPAIVGLRDEKTRAAVAGSLAEDETAIFNSRAIVVIRASGAVEVRAASGVALALATKADLDALRDYIANLTLPVSTQGSATAQAGYAGPPLATPAPPSGWLPALSGQPPTADGTTVLKGQ